MNYLHLMNAFLLKIEILISKRKLVVLLNENANYQLFIDRML